MALQAIKNFFKDKYLVPWPLFYGLKGRVRIASIKANRMRALKCSWPGFVTQPVNPALESYECERVCRAGAFMDI